MGLFDGLVAYYDFRNWDLSNLVTGEKATNNGATLTTDHLGYENCAYNFNSWYITLPKPIHIGWGDLTIIALFKKDSAYSEQTHIIWNNNKQANRWNLAVSDNGQKSVFFWNDNWDNDLLIVLNQNVIDWKYHMTTFISSSAWSKLILDDFVEEKTSARTINFSSDTNYIWYHPAQNVNFKWDVSLILVFERALSNSEVKLLYKLLMH